MKNLYILVLIVLINSKGFGQQENLYYEKGMDVILDSLVQENPKIKFYLSNSYATSNTSNDPFGGFECNINFDSLKQNNLDSAKIVIPDKHKNRLKKDSFFNKIIYGKRLMEINIEMLYKDSNDYLFRANIYGNEGGIFMFVLFKNNSLDVNEFCKAYSIY